MAPAPVRRHPGDQPASDLKMATQPTGNADSYEPKPLLWQRYPQLGWILAVFAGTVLLTYASFPPFDVGEAAYAFAIPALLWAFRRPAFRTYAWTIMGAQAVVWTLLLGWLHNVTWLGLFLLGPFVGLLIGLWYLAAWWAIGRMAGHQALVRIVILLGLAAFWVVLEWVRSTLFGGFPWLPLAASQWHRPLILQSAAYAGSWSVSFILTYFNLAAAAYAHRIFFEGARGLRKRSPEFSVALVVLMAGAFPFLSDFLNQKRAKLTRVALVQPYIPQNEKWDAGRSADILRTIERVTLDAGHTGAPDLIFWPEAVTPWALHRDPNVEPWLDSVAKAAGRPILLGTIYTEPGAGSDENWYNGAAAVDPVTGLLPQLYAKRKLVPFGEYIPLRPLLGWLDKVVPIGGDFQRGSDATPFLLTSGTLRISVGVLICYEDIFPNLARDSVQSGAEVIAVLTNNGWFGEGGAAYQHAAHSVLRAVETRRPVIRCGNGGWSGWIDEFGNIRATLTDDNGSVYFRGAETLAISRDLRWRNRLTFYTEHGDWFPAVCALLAVAAYYLAVALRPAPLRSPDDSAY